MDEKLEFPACEEGTGVFPVTLSGTGLTFNTQKSDVDHFPRLRKVDYGSYFRMSSMPELSQLVHFAFENENRYDSAKRVMRALKDHHLMANTGILYASKGIFAQDNPNVNGKISMDERILENQLSSYEENGVVFSDDKTIRFTPYGFKDGETQTPSELAKNKGVVALLGGEENAEKLLKVSKSRINNPSFYGTGIPKYGDPPGIRIAQISLDPGAVLGKWFKIFALYPDTAGYGPAFGVKSSKNN